MAAARSDLQHLEEQQELRLQWVAEHGPDLAAGPQAAAELARREEERAARPYADLDDEQLHAAVINARGEVASIDRQRAEFIGVADTYQAQAAQLDQEATVTEWERPAWTAVKQERHAETAAMGRLADIDDRLDRGFLRGGPRGHERADLNLEAGRLRSDYPEAAAGVDRSPVWEERAEIAWSHDTATAQQLRANAATLRDKANRVHNTLPMLTDQRDRAQDRVSQLGAEQVQRQDEPPRPRQPAAPDPGPFGPWESLSNGPDVLSPSLGPYQPSIDPQRGHGPQL